MNHRRGAAPAVAAGLVIGLLTATGCTSTEKPSVQPIAATTPTSSAGTSAVGLTTYPADHAALLPELTGADLTGSGLRIPAAGAAATVVNVWASWCRPCVTEMPKLRSIATRFAADDVVVQGIATRDKTAAAVSFLSATGFDLPSLADPNGAKAARWGSIVPAAAVPSTLVVDSAGRVRARWIGAVDEARLGDEICATLREEKHATASCPG